MEIRLIVGMMALSLSGQVITPPPGGGGGGSPTGAAGNGLAGTYPNPAIAFPMVCPTASTPSTPSAGTVDIFCPSAGGGLMSIDASNNQYAMPSSTILSAPANGLWAGPTSGSNAAPAYRAIVGADLAVNAAANLTAIGGVNAAGAIAAVSGNANLFTQPQKFSGANVLGSTTSSPVTGAGFTSLQTNYYNNLYISSMDVNSVEYAGALATWYAERAGWVQFGYYNLTGSTVSGIPSGVAQANFGYSPTGQVCSLTDTWISDGITTRNCLDDGSGNAVVAGTTKSVFFQGNDAAPAASACGTGASVLSGSSTLGGTVTEGTSATGCTITLSNAPLSCTLTSESGLAFRYSLSSAVLTVVNIGALSSTSLDYKCTK